MKKIIIAILVVLLVINPVGVYASSTAAAAAALEVTGSLASGGLADGAQSEKLALAFTMMVIYGMGMSVKLTEQAQAAGETAQSYIKKLYVKWVGGTSAEQLTESQREELKKRFKVISSGGSDQSGNSNNKISKNGIIFLASASLAMIRKFLNWCKKNNQIIPDQMINPGGTVNGTYYGKYVSTQRNDGKYWVAGMWESNTGNGNASANVAWVKFKSGGSYILLAYRPASEGPFYMTFKDNSDSPVPSAPSSPGLYSKSVTEYGYEREHIGNGSGTASWDLSGLLDITSFGSTENYLRQLNGEWDTGQGEAGEDHISGEYNDSDLENANDSYTQIDPALYQQLLQNLDANTVATINIADYVNAIMQQLNRQSNPSAVPETETVPLVNPTDLSPIPQPLPDPVPDPVPTTLPQDEPAPGDNDPPADSDPVSNPDPAPPDVSVPKMMIPLDEYFPFCIPFDVYHLLQKLSADPVAPSYTIGFTVYGTEVNYTISLDAFSGAMVMVRRMELFVCVIGLAIASRKIFTR